MNPMVFVIYQFTFSTTIKENFSCQLVDVENERDILFLPIFAPY